MNTLRLGLRENRTQFAPGDRIAGAVDWEFETVPDLVEVRLGWSTKGKGNTDVVTVDRLRFQQLAATGLRSFELTAPAAPYSFSGRLVSLIWAVEVVAEPGDWTETCEIVIAPGGQEVLLAGVAEG